MTERIEKMAERAMKSIPRQINLDVYTRSFQADITPVHIQKKANCIQFFLEHDEPQMAEGSLLIGDARVSSIYRIPGFMEETLPIDDSEGNFSKLWCLGGNHRTANFKYVLTHGFQGYQNRIAHAMQKYPDDEKKQQLYRAMDTVLSGIIRYILRCGSHCAELSQTEPDARRKKELSDMAQICQAISLKEPTGFYEALQCYWFVFMLFPDGLGRLDQYLFPFYQRDLAAGKITREFAAELLQNLFLNVFLVFGSSHEWSGLNHMVVGGYTEDGRDGYNALTEMIVTIISELPTYRPQLTFRWTKHTSREQLHHVVCAMKNRFDMIMLTNDEVMLDGITGMGVPLPDAAEYSLSGCNEMVITGMSQMGSLEGHLNLLHALEKTIFTKPALPSFAEFYAEFRKNLQADVQKIVRLSEFLDTERMKQADILASLMTDDCIENGRTISEGGARYNSCTWIAAGLINAADSLNVIEEFVYQKKLFSLDKLAQMLQSNWNGFEDVRSEIQRSTVFWGNGCAAKDEQVNRIVEILNDTVKSAKPVRGGHYTFGTLTGYELSHVMFGKNTGATPDGRFRGEALTPTLTALNGKDKNGITAYLKSVTNIDFHALPSAVVVNLKLDRSYADTAEKTWKLTDLINAYLNMGGVQLQINYVSADELQEAQRTPEKYCGLRVRVTGFSGFFTTFERELQDEIIRRTTQE